MPDYITVISVKTVRGGLTALKTDINEYLYKELDGILPRADRRRAGTEYRIIYISPSAEEKYGIKQGVRLDYSKLVEIVEESNYLRAKSKALALLTGRDYSSGGLLKKLREYYPLKASQCALGDMHRLGIVKDEDYAAKLAGEIISHRGMSKKMAAVHMRNKGVADDLISRALDNTEYDPRQSIISLIQSKYRRHLSDEAGRRRLFAALGRRGFSYEDIKSVMEAFIEQD